MQNRIGYGIDVLQLKKGTPLIIGGVSISCSKGSKGIVMEMYSIMLSMMQS